MLKLDYGLEREIKTQLLGKLRAEFSRYFDFITSGSLANSLSQGLGTNTDNLSLTADREQVSQRMSVRSDPIKSKIFEIFLDSNEGASLALSGSTSIKQKLQTNFITTDSLSQEQIQENTAKIAECVRMHYAAGATFGGAPSSTQAAEVLKNDLETVGLRTSEEKNNITVFELLHPLMMPGEKNAELLTVFFNAMPTLEMARATPVLDIKIYSSRRVEQDGKLAAITLHKFLEGAVDIPQSTSSSLRAINLSNQVMVNTGSMFGQADGASEPFSLVGLELFTAPQTLQNISATKNTDNYLAPIIDPMRPLASIKSLEIEVRPTVGLMQTKTAKLNIVLHDRSRLGEFADFVKPDRYGSSFIDIEYGWSHPDGIYGIDRDSSLTSNPYAQLLNLTRAKEHYGIMSSNFSFDDVGQVNITLNLYTRGSAESGEISITSPLSNDLREGIKKLEELSKQINRLTSIVFSNRTSSGEQSGNNGRRTEIRGQQMLTAASDSQNMLILNDQLFNSLRDLRRTLANISNSTGQNAATEAQKAAARRLNADLGELVGNTADDTHGENARDPRRTVADGSLVRAVQNSINGSIHEALQTINVNANGQSVNTNPYDFDIFLKNMPQAIKNRLRAAGMRMDGVQPESQAQLNGAQLVETPIQSRRSRGTTRRAASTTTSTTTTATATTTTTTTATAT